MKIKNLLISLLILAIPVISAGAETIYYRPITSADNPSFRGNVTVNGIDAGDAGIYLNSAVPSSITDTLYNNAGALYWSGSPIGFNYTPEDVANKAFNFSVVNDILYPTVKAVKDYADSLVWGLLDDRGNYDASGNVFPSTGGSGDGGAILKGDVWKISVAGRLGSVSVSVNDSVRALVDSPGQTAENWGIISGEIIAGTGLSKTGQILSVNLSTGIAGGQTIYGGTAASENITIRSTTNLTTGNILLGENLAKFNESLDAIYFYPRPNLVDYMIISGTSSGGGVANITTWANGWNIDVTSAGKNLYLNRNTQTTNNLYLGRQNYELTILGSNGNVGVKNLNPTANFDAQPATIGIDSFTRPFPSLTTLQRNSLINFSEGVGVWDNNTDSLYIHDGTQLRAQRAPSTVYVYSIFDLPPPADGKITLPGGLIYYFPAWPISIPYELVLGDEIQLYDPYITDLVSITFVGSAAFHMGSLHGSSATTFYNYSGSVPNKIISLDRTTTVLPAGATLFGISSTQDCIFLCKSSAVASTGAIALGTIYTCKIDISGITGKYMYPVASGLVFNDNDGITLSELEIPNSASSPTTLLTFGGDTQGVVQLEKLFLNNSGTDVYALKFDTATTFTEAVSNHNGSVSDGTKVFAPSSYTQATVGIKFSNVFNVSDSTTQNFSYFENNALTTTIAANDTSYKINAVWTNVSTERMLFNSNGTFTYVGNEKNNLNVRSYITLDPASTQDTVWSAYIYKNGSIVAFSKFRTGIKSNETLTLITEARIDTNKNDFFEVMVERNTGTGDVVITNGKIIIEK